MNIKGYSFNTYSVEKFDNNDMNYASGCCCSCCCSCCCTCSSAAVSEMEEE